MITGLVLYINNDLCELYIVEENRRAFAFLPSDALYSVSLGKRYVVYPHDENLLFVQKEVSLC